MRIVAALLAAAVLLSPNAAAAQAKPPINVAQGLSMLSALRNLDGRIVVVKVNGTDQTVVVPWEFGSGTLRIKVAKNIAILAENERAVESARQSIIKEILAKGDPDKDGKPPTSIQPGTPEFDLFQRQYQQALDALASGTADLMRFKSSELKLERNEIPVTALAALSPILDLD